MTPVNGFGEAWRSNMDDWDGPDLVVLVTPVDHLEARSLFERRRVRRHRQRIGFRVAAISLVLVLVVAAGVALRPSDDGAAPVVSGRR